MIVYKCDICKKVCEDNKFITMSIPTNKYIYAMKNGIKLAKFKSDIELSNIEICPTCAMHIANFLDSLGVSS
jgi:epoxyqueuosine reductase QueG